MGARIDKDGSSFKMSLKATIILAVVVAVIFMFAGGWIRGAITKFFNPQQELTNEVVVKQLEKIQDLTTAKETDYGFEKYEDGGIAFLNKKQFTMFYTYEVRAGVDQIDRELVALLARRFGYMDAAARIKTDRNSVRDEARKAEVLDNIARAAEAAGLEPARLRAVWNELVEQSIAYEAIRWDALRG